MRRSVSILTHTLSGNAFGRAWLLAELLRHDFDVHIVAACRAQDEVWQPVRAACDIEVRRWMPWSFIGFKTKAPSVARALVTGDVLYAVKPRLPSFGLGLLAREQRHRPLLVDIDDDELGFTSLARDIALSPWALASAASDLHTRLYERRVAEADAVTVSNGLLHERYGGTWIPHARDAQMLFPRARAVPGAVPTVMFVGTPRAHKGLTMLVRAFQRIRTPAVLRIVGGALSQELRELRAPNISVEAPIPFEELPAQLAMADVVAIPQDDSRASRGQLPAKLLDAMAMGKAIISTRVGDIPRWLADDAGVVVTAGDEDELTRALDELLSNPARMQALGERARRRFITYGAYATVRPRLVALVHRLAAQQPVPRAGLLAPWDEQGNL